MDGCSRANNDEKLKEKWSLVEHGWAWLSGELTVHRQSNVCFGAYTKSSGGSNKHWSQSHDQTFNFTLGSDISTVTKLSAAHTELCRGSWGSFLPISGGILTCISNAQHHKVSSDLLSHCVELNHIRVVLLDCTDRKTKDLKENDIIPSTKTKFWP